MNATMINTLTSLRLFFALMVFGAHCYVVDSTFSTHFYKEGFVGVSFFFILSGFIIAYNYQQKLVERKVSKRQFWVARIARIYPLHIATLLGVAVIGNLLNPMGWGVRLKHFDSCAVPLHLLFPGWITFFDFDSPSWSLGCEQLFSFLISVFERCFLLKNPEVDRSTFSMRCGGSCFDVNDRWGEHPRLLVCESVGTFSPIFW